MPHALVRSRTTEPHKARAGVLSAAKTETKDECARRVASAAGHVARVRARATARSGRDGSRLNERVPYLCTLGVSR